MASITKRANGWQAQVRRSGFKTVSKRFEKKSEAILWARSIESKIDSNELSDISTARKTTLKEILDRYLTEISINKISYKSEKSRIKTLIASPISKRSLYDLKSSDVAFFRDSRLKTVSPTTVNKELNTLHLVIDTARRDWSISISNPVKLIKRPKNNRARDRRLEAGELEKIISLTESEILKSVVLFALETAMRRGEIAKAKWNHLKLDKQVLSIPETKTGEPRAIPLSKKAIEILQDIKKDTDYIFNISSGSISQAFRRACTRGDIVDLNFHDLRHEATSRLFEKGLNPMQVSVITGHKSFEMLKRYTHLKAEDLVKLLN